MKDCSLKRCGSSVIIFSLPWRRSENMNSPMGPIYFIVYGIIGKIFRFFHLLDEKHSSYFFFFLLLLISRYISACRYRNFLIFLFIINPYFLVMTGPFLYTDVLGLLFVYLGLLSYRDGKSQFLTGLFWGVAICTRQLFVIVPLAAMIHNLYRSFFEDKLYFIDLIAPLIAFLFFLPLYVLWDYNVNSGAFAENSFQENTLEAFSFSLKTFNYSLILIGLFAAPVLFKDFIIAYSNPKIPILLLAILLSILAFPVNVNRDMQYGNLPATAGLLDIFFNKIGIFKYLVVPSLLHWGLSFMVELFRYSWRFKSFFFLLLILLFLLLESFYSYCWDKHFLIIIPVVFVISDRITKQKEEDFVKQFS
ncbi:MAG: hypothetical protein U5Q03_01915 [Bacteroidota bacterium]|nr:hypothetical protein [Bacteroidota bacterium]